MKADWISPQWPAPASVEAWVTTRGGGVSLAPWDSFNVGTRVGDSASHVRTNRQRLQQQLPAGIRLQWLNQVHGTHIVKVNAAAGALTRKTADAAAVFAPGAAAVVMTADCLPVFFCDTAGTRVAVAHAGWRGLLDGVLENTMHALDVPSSQLMAWMGPAIAACHFQVGSEVRAAFIDQHSKMTGDAVSIQALHAAFVACTDDAGKWMMDIYAVATLRLQACGITGIYGGGLCTVCDAQRFFSYRRDGVTGRMASLIYLKS